ncbi:ATP-binding protein [Acidocella sp.]|jgi:two-component system phosphate regulon sensor histidine kinase PhoR|uniref:ATP-binding protein n=1 Tax=Acidocella sp. TaxID=50710 RepID=UPI002F3F5611
MDEGQLSEPAWPATFASFLALGALPTLVFGLLVAFGELHWLPGLIGWALCTVVAAGFGALLGREVLTLTRLVRALRGNADDVPTADTALLVPGIRALGEEAVRLVHAEHAARARIIGSAAEDRALVERLPDPLLKLDADGNLVWRNASAIAAFGMETAALLRHPALRAALTEARGGLPVRSKIAVSVPVPRELDATVIPVGGPLYVLISDRTRERSLEKMRADFVANSSHELRTPLASLIGFIETLRGPAADDPEAQKRFLGIMAEQAARMQRMIDDLLNLSKIEISEHQPPAELLDLRPLLERIVAGMEPLLKASSTRMEVAIPPGLPQVPADADQLAQVFSNLLDNALKYGKRGGCIRLVAAHAVSDARFESGGVLVSVTDDGMGIAREHIPRLTERFYRVDKGRSRAVGGTGLGLAIVKHVVSRHRGRLVIDSVEGKGTTFTVWLPSRSAKVTAMTPAV